MSTPPIQLGKKQDADRIKRSTAASSTYKKATWNSDRKPNQVGVDDMTLLTELSDKAINTNLSSRFNKSEIYTYIGHVLISVNPFRDLGIYTDQVLDSYIGRNLIEMPPHVFAIAESAYYRMKSYSDNQCVIISGESGAGKTEAAKKIMQYIAHVSGGEGNSSIQHVKDMVLATNPLLESFGNAKTLKNNNSSRFGKYLEIYFNDRSEPIGAHITNYLLEKSRVTTQIINERNFHIFYQICKAASAEHRDYGISGPECYTYTCGSNCLTVDGVNDSNEYNDVLQAMKIIGLSSYEQSDIHRLLAAILWLGNVEFDVNPDGNGEDAIIASQIGIDALNSVAFLLQVNTDQLQTSLLNRVIITPRSGGKFERLMSPLNITQARGVRDALAKGIYARLFDWIVERVNLAMKPHEPVAKSIGILDIYGFELFEKNSFEQLCINYVNEMLQAAFINLTIKTEQDDYIAEGIQWSPIEFFDNKIVCELIEEKRPTPGIFAIMNDACARVHADPEKADQTLESDLKNVSHTRFFAQTGTFTIKHYAGDVTYTISGMSEKNRDAANKDLLELIKTSGHQLLQKLFPEDVDRENRQRPPTVSDKIKHSSGELFNTLMQCQPNYIRCIKPNQTRNPRDYDDSMCMHQIKYLGLLQNVKVRRAGFASRQPSERFLERFYMLSSKTCYAGECTWTGQSMKGAQIILEHSGIPEDQWQLGKTKVFIKSPETLFKLEAMREHYWHKMVLRIQRAWHRYQERRAKAVRKIQQVWRDHKGLNSYVQMRDLGHRVYNGRKERRRFSLVSMRRYLGDYLDVAGQGGAFLRTAAQLSLEDLIIFSSRAQTVIFRFLRSSKLSPRMIIMTNRHLISIVSKVDNGQVIQQIDRKIPLVDIKKVTLTAHQDDFFLLSVEGDEDMVLVCPFKTELVTYLVYQVKTQINIATELLYTNKKQAKSHIIKSTKDDSGTIKGGNWVYKKDKIIVNTGAPPSSVSDPPCPRNSGGTKSTSVSRKPVQPPVTSKHTPKPAPKTAVASSVHTSKINEPTNTMGIKPSSTNSSSPVKSTTSTTIVGQIPVQPAMNAISPASSIGNLATNSSLGSASTGIPPRRPPPRPVPSKPTYKVLYAFQGQDSGELSIVVGDIVEVVTKQDGGWWLAKNSNGQEGWVPESYLELIQTPPSRPNLTPTPTSINSNTSSTTNATTISTYSESSTPGSQVIPIAVVDPVTVSSSVLTDPSIPEWKRQLLTRLEQQKQAQGNRTSITSGSSVRPPIPRR